MRHGVPLMPPIVARFGSAAGRSASSIRPMPILAALPAA